MTSADRRVCTPAPFVEQTLNIFTTNIRATERHGGMEDRNKEREEQSDKVRKRELHGAEPLLS
jgi:hypothetical protein